LLTDKKFSELVTILFNVFVEIANRFIQMAIQFCKAIKDHVTKFEELKTHDRDRLYKRQLYKLNFDRPKTSHQVISNKPKNLIRKIIH